MSAQLALDVRNLSVSFPMRGRDADGRRRRLLAVDDVSFSVARGKTLGIVGESGSGKTTAAMAVARLVPKMAGSIIIDGTDFGALDTEALRRARQRVLGRFHARRACDGGHPRRDSKQLGTPAPHRRSRSV